MFYLQADQFKDVNGNTNAIAVASQGVVYTKAQKVGAAGAFGLSVLLASTGTPNVKIEMQVSDNATAALEGIADSVGATWCIQEGGSPIWTALADKVLHKITVNPTPCQYIRLKITGNSGNPADTTIVAKMITQQQLGR